MNREDAERIVRQIISKTEYLAWVVSTPVAGVYCVEAEPPGDRQMYPIAITDETLNAAAVLFEAGVIGTNEEVKR